MNPNNTQAQNVDLTPEESLSSLGLATRLSEQMLMSQVPQEDMGMDMEDETSSQTSQESQGKEIMPEMVKDEGVDNMEGKMDEKMEILRTEMKDTIKMEIEGIRNDIKSALENEN